MNPVQLVPYDPAWAFWASEEQAHLRSALGFCTEGGYVYDLEHVGATSVPGLVARPMIDLAMRVYPLPPAADALTKLVDLGYGVPYQPEPGLMVAEAEVRKMRLHLMSFDTDFWDEFLLIRDYLHADKLARDRIDAKKVALANEGAAAYRAGERALFTELFKEAQGWHVARTGFAPLERLKTDLAGLTAQWFVSSGWALDLFLGQPQRRHDDLDVVFWRDEAHLARDHLLGRGWQVHLPTGDERVYQSWTSDLTLPDDAMQAHARRGADFLDLLFSPRGAGVWVYRRGPLITRALPQAILERDGIPYLAPEAVLLFKSRASVNGREAAPRGKDQSDFERVLPRLSAEQRAWLRSALEHARADHPWLIDLQADNS